MAEIDIAKLHAENQIKIAANAEIKRLTLLMADAPQTEHASIQELINLEYAKTRCPKQS